MSLSAHSLNSPYKIRALWTETKKHHADILCVQKSHFQASNPLKCSQESYPHIFFANVAVKKKESLLLYLIQCLYYTQPLCTQYRLT